MHNNHRVTIKLDCRKDRRNNTHRSLCLRRQRVVIIQGREDREEDSIMSHNRGEGGLVSFFSFLFVVFISSSVSFCPFRGRRGKGKH